MSGASVTDTGLEEAGPPPHAGTDSLPGLPEFLRLVEASGRGGDAHLPHLRVWTDLAEAWRIVRALERCRGNRSAAARELGIGRRTLYTKMERLGIAEGWSFRGRA